MHSVYSIIKTMLLRKLSIFNSHRLATIDMTNAEYLSILGLAYRANIDQTFAIGESLIVGD